LGKAQQEAGSHIRVRLGDLTPNEEIHVLGLWREFLDHGRRFRTTLISLFAGTFLL
jgi:hypothetical protein